MYYNKRKFSKIPAKSLNFKTGFTPPPKKMEVVNMTHVGQGDVFDRLPIIWSILDNVKEKYCKDEDQLVSSWDVSSSEECRKIALQAVEQTLADQLQALIDFQNGATLDSPCFQYPAIAWKNVRFDPDVGLVPKSGAVSTNTTYYNRSASKLRYTRILVVLRLIQELLIQDQHATKRELYYRHVNLFSKQSELDDVVNAVCIMLQIPRNHLRILATSKGLVAGNLVMTTADGVRIECSNAVDGELIPQNVKGIRKIETGARGFW